MIRVSPSIVRNPTAADHLEVWRMLMQDHNENGIFPMDASKVDWLIWRLLNPDSIAPQDTGTRGVMGVIGPQGALEAVAAVVIASSWYSNHLCLNDLVVYVDPNYRHSGHAKALIEWMKSQSTETGIPLISGVVTKERTQAKCRLYQRQMPVKLGEYFLHEPKASILTSSGVGVNGYARG